VKIRTEEVIHLLPREEVVGNLQEIPNEENKITLSFKEGIRLSLLPDPRLIGSLQEKVGKKIGILRTDLPSKTYLVRDEK
jgi:hypothetical protein